MALTFYWRCEGETLSGTDDLSPDTSAATIGSPTIDAAAANYGSNGVLIDVTGEHYRFDNTSEQIIDDVEGCMGCWVRFTGTPATNNEILYGVGGTNIEVNLKFFGSSDIRFQIVEPGGPTSVNLDTSGASLSANTWYFVVVRWNHAANDRRIEIYDSGMSEISGSPWEDLATSWTTAGSLSSSTGWRIGGTNASTIHIDNVFCASNYDEPIEDNATITSYTQYGAPASDIILTGQVAI